MTAIHGMGDSKFVQLQAIFEMSRRALQEQIRERDTLTSPQAVRDYLKLPLGGLQREVFTVLFLDAQNRVAGTEELFAGTLKQTSVCPLEVVKRALHHNAAAVVFAHNHPSGVAESSGADELLTKALKEALAQIDVRVLYHFVVAGNASVSFAERGLL
jgi:DNA repair protein RadC